MAAPAALQPLKRAPSRAAWRAFQVPTRPGAGFSLARLDPAAQPLGTGDEAADKAAIAGLAAEIDTLQDLLHANKDLRMLVVLQGTDASGKDGTIRHVFSRVSPLGTRVAGWRAPSEEERAHDFLWRIHQKAPAAGELVVFNRSHYEDLLIPMAGGTLAGAALARRIRQVNDFERLLAETGTVVLKFMLNISRAEQKERLQARLDDPSKAWKFAPGDLEVRRQWDAYRRAYQRVLAATSTPHAPWLVVPADSKTQRNLFVATVVRDVLKSLRLAYPPPDPAVAGVRIR